MGVLLQVLNDKTMRVVTHRVWDGVAGLPVYVDLYGLVSLCITCIGTNS